MNAPAWGAVLRLAASRFRMTPREVWALSLREWRALVEPAAAAPLTRTQLDALILQHPDDPS